MDETPFVSAWDDPQTALERHSRDLLLVQLERELDTLDDEAFDPEYGVGELDEVLSAHGC